MSSRGAEPAKYALDTNIFINAFRDNAAANALDAFFRRALVVTFLSSVVVQELGAGARARKDAVRLQRAIFAPFERRNRIVAPSAAAFKRAAGYWLTWWRGKAQTPSAGIARLPTILSSRLRAESAASRSSRVMRTSIGSGRSSSDFAS